MKKSKPKSILVIGMGRFGKHIAMYMQEMGNSVMVVDRKPELEHDLVTSFQDYLIGDCTNKHVLAALGIPEFDICFVTIGTNFESSIIITSNIKSLGAKYIVTKAGREVQTDVLKKIGADEVVYPEKELAQKLAFRYSSSNSKNILDYIELAGAYSIFEIAVPAEWVGQTIGALNVRQKYKVNILAIKHESSMQALPSADCLLNSGDAIILMGANDDVLRASTS